MEKRLSILREKAEKKQKDSKVMGCLDIWGEKDLHTNRKVWDIWIPVSQEKQEKIQNIFKW